jgi:hypothetical protein
MAPRVPRPHDFTRLPAQTSGENFDAALAAPLQVFFKAQRLTKGMAGLFFPLLRSWSCKEPHHFSGAVVATRCGCGSKSHAKHR